MSKDQKVKCSICGKLVTRQGLPGHMRFKHGVESKHHKPVGQAQRPTLVNLASGLTEQTRGLTEQMDRLIDIDEGLIKAVTQLAQDVKDLDNRVNKLEHRET